MVVHSKGHGGGIRSFQMTGQNLIIGKGVKLHSRGVHVGIRGINAVHIFCHQDGICLNLHAPEHRTGVCGEIRIAGSGGKNDNLSLVQIAVGSIPGKILGKFIHFHSRQHPGLNPVVLQSIRNRN